MRQKSTTIILFFFISILIFSFYRCDKFEGNQTVPAYISIDSVGFTTDYNTQGTASNKFVDAWVYIDDQLVGGFEVPTVFPVLYEGQHRLEIIPGIKLNGISETRAPYPCLEPFLMQGINLFIDSIVHVRPETVYRSNVVFIWMEDFEDPSLSIFCHPESDTNMTRTPPDAPGAFLDQYSAYSGITNLDTVRNYIYLQSDDDNGEGFALDRGDYIFLEINIKSEIPVAVGMLIKRSSLGIEKRPFIFLNKSEDWNKIYVNFTPMVNETTDAINYRVFFEAELPSGNDHAVIMFDNIKLLSRPNL